LFLCLWAFSWAIAHSFGVPGWFTRSMTLSTCLRGMTKNSSFLRLWTFLWAIVHSFGVLRWFTWSLTILGFREDLQEYDSLYILERNAKKLVDFAFMAVFVRYCPQFWGLEVIYQAHDT
jgi:hypothetical protein